VRHVKNALVSRGCTQSSSLCRSLTLLVVNCGDSTACLSGGYYKSAIHRVVKSPVDQSGFRRLGLIYFQYMSDDVRLAPLLHSPVVRREGITKSIYSGPPTQETWRKNRVTRYGVSQLQRAEDGNEYEIVKGVWVTHCKT